LNGAETINRSASTGQVTSPGIGVLSSTLGYSGFGELADTTTSANNSPLYSASYTRDEIERVRTHGSDYKQLERGREAWYDRRDNTVVISDSGHPDLGTVFRPSGGLSYFQGLK
jgi:hypothetical protein